MYKNKRPVLENVWIEEAFKQNFYWQFEVYPEKWTHFEFKQGVSSWGRCPQTPGVYRFGFQKAPVFAGGKRLCVAAEQARRLNSSLS